MNFLGMLEMNILLGDDVTPSLTQLFDLVTEKYFLKLVDDEFLSGISCGFERFNNFIEDVEKNDDFGLFQTHSFSDVLLIAECFHFIRFEYFFKIIEWFGS